MNIYPNAYYNYLAQRKKAYQQQKHRILQKIKDIFDPHGILNPGKIWEDRSD